MRYDLVNRGGTRLGEVMLAEGVTLASVGRDLLGGARLVPKEERERELVAKAVEASQEAPPPATEAGKRRPPK